MLSLIVAVDSNGVIGREGCLPWHLPKDFLWFRKHTLGKPVVMGRKTFDSLGGKPLAGRTNFVMSRQPMTALAGVQCFTDPQQVLADLIAEPEIMILGGASIYHWFLPHAKRLYLTQVHAAIDGDTYFPSWEPQQWRLVTSQYQPADTENAHAMTFQIYERHFTSIG